MSPPTVTPHGATPPGRCPVTHGSRPDSEKVFALYSPEFAMDPHAIYVEMRRSSCDFVPVELAPGVPATLVIGYYAALRILYDDANFRADPREWQQTIPLDCPVLPMLEHRPNALRSDLKDHERYRSPTVAALRAVDRRALHTVVAEIGEQLIAEFSSRGTTDFSSRGTANLITDYALPLAFETINAMLGCPAEVGVDLARGFELMFDATAGSEAVNTILDEAFAALIALKRQQPAKDVTTTLMAHAVGMTNYEISQQLLTMYAAAIEPLQNLIANTVFLMVTDRRFEGDVVGGALSTRDALDEVLYRDPPLANLCVRYPRQPIVINDYMLPARKPVVIGMAAASTDPRVTRKPDNSGYVDFSRSSAHLAFSAGPHVCPAREIAYQIAEDAIDQLLDWLPELELDCRVQDLRWRPGPFHRAIAQLPVAFPTRLRRPPREPAAPLLLSHARGTGPTGPVSSMR
ncbi:cytochrome P450 [Nocardia amikacinitolerans]|uniref:cytochrome P450 n=1 Tax=Nocardia amikacinitolerans TaxID=756689 RepID=UPI00367A0A64